jgi:hypothetical protein
MTASDAFSEYYAELLQGTYDCVDRIVLNAFFPVGQTAGGIRTWWRFLRGDATVCPCTPAGAIRKGSAANFSAAVAGRPSDSGQHHGRNASIIWSDVSILPALWPTPGMMARCQLNAQPCCRAASSASRNTV